MLIIINSQAYKIFCSVIGTDLFYFRNALFLQYLRALGNPQQIPNIILVVVSPLKPLFFMFSG